MVQHPHGSQDSNERMSSGRLGYLQGFMKPLLGLFFLLCQLRGRSGLLSLPDVAACQVNSISTYSVFSISPLASIISFPF